MDALNILTLIISLLALLVTYSVFKSDQQPQIIIFATPHYGKPSLIQLHIKNIGKSIAENIRISSDQPIPRGAFGISRLNEPQKNFESGIFKYGVKVFPPNQSYIFDWGQFGGLKEALNQKPITFKVTYLYKHPLNLWKTKVTDISVIDIHELEALPSSDGGLIEQLTNINKELRTLNSKIDKKILDNLISPPSSLTSILNTGYLCSKKYDFRKGNFTRSTV